MIFFLLNKLFKNKINYFLEGYLILHLLQLQLFDFFSVFYELLIYFLKSKLIFASYLK